MGNGGRWVELGQSAGRKGGDEAQYVWASMSVAPELCVGMGLPQHREDARRQGYVHAYGALLTGIAGGKCRVDFMADVDPSARVSPQWMVDRDVRLQMLYS